MPNITHANALFEDQVPSTIPRIYLSKEEIEEWIALGYLVFFIVESNNKGNLIPIREGGAEKKGRFLCTVCAHRL